MAITGISAISGEQIIAAGAVSAREAASAAFTTGGNSLQGLYDTVSNNSGSWTGGSTYTGDAQGALDEVYSNSANWNNVTGKLDASAVNSAFIPGLGSGVSGIDNKPIFVNYARSANYAKFDENGTYLTSYLTAVPTGTMNETAFAYDSDNLIASYNGSAFAATLPASADAMLETVYRSGAVWDTVTGKLDGSASSSFYTTANESGFITGVPAGTMNESNFGYDASDNITAYNGSAFKAGDEFPQSATEAIETVTANSADWNGTTDTVSSNSGAWGGSALPISAGPGIKFEMVNNTLVASTDETLLWSGNAGFGEMPITLSESMNNFENIEFTWIPRYNGDYGSPTRVDKLSTNSYNGKLQWTLGGFYRNAGTNWLGYVCLSANNTSTVLTHDSSFYINPATTAAPGNNLAFRVCKIVGINRIAGV